MILNLVADYELPNGKRFARTFAIHSINNLVDFRDMTAMPVKTTKGRLVPVFPKTVLMCESHRKAQDVARTWQKDYETQGLLWDSKPIAVSESEDGSDWM